MKEESRKFYENLKTDEDIQNSEDEYIDNIPLDEAEDLNKNCSNNLMFLYHLKMCIFFLLTIIQINR